MQVNMGIRGYNQKGSLMRQMGRKEELANRSEAAKHLRTALRLLVAKEWDRPVEEITGQTVIGSDTKLAAQCFAAAHKAGTAHPELTIDDIVFS